MLNRVNVAESHERVEADEVTGMAQVLIPVEHAKAVVGDFVDFVPTSFEECELYKVQAIERLGEKEFWNAVISGCRVKYASKVRKPKDPVKDEKKAKDALDNLDEAQLARLLERYNIS